MSLFNSRMLGIGLSNSCFVYLLSQGRLAGWIQVQPVGTGGGGRDGRDGHANDADAGRDQRARASPAAAGAADPRRIPIHRLAKIVYETRAHRCVYFLFLYGQCE